MYCFGTGNLVIWYLFSFLCYRRRTARLVTTNDIADALDAMEEDSFDDSDADKDYEVEKESSSSSSPEDTGDEEERRDEEERLDKGNGDEEERLDKEKEKEKERKALKLPKKPTEVRVYMNPPVEKADGDTDKDSDDSDEPSCLVKHLPRRLLGAGAKKRQTRRTGVGKRVEAVSDSDDDEVEVETRGKWVRKNPQLVGSKTPNFIKPDRTPDKKKLLMNRKTAYDYYQLFQPNTFAEETVAQSKLYALQKDLKKGDAAMNINTLRCTEALLLHSGYHHVPRRRMLWEQKQDCYNPLVANSIRRAEVEGVLSCLHFRDNSLIDDDGYYKVIMMIWHIHFFTLPYLHTYLPLNVNKKQV